MTTKIRATIRSLLATKPIAASLYSCTNPSLPLNLHHEPIPPSPVTQSPTPPLNTDQTKSSYNKLQPQCPAAIPKTHNLKKNKKILDNQDSNHHHLATMNPITTSSSFNLHNQNHCTELLPSTLLAIVPSCREPIIQQHPSATPIVDHELPSSILTLSSIVVTQMVGNYHLSHLPPLGCAPSCHRST